MLAFTQNLFYNAGTGNDKRIVIPAGTTNLLVPIEVPRTGLVHRLIVKQNSGTSIGATINLYAHNLTGTNPPPAEIVRIIPVQTLSAGQTLHWSSDSGAPFVALIRDDNNPLKYYIYLSFTITAQGAATYWDASLVWRTADLY